MRFTLAPSRPRALSQNRHERQRNMRASREYEFFARRRRAYAPIPRTRMGRKSAMRSTRRTMTMAALLAGALALTSTTMAQTSPPQGSAA